MKFLDITGLKQVISKLQEWTEVKLSKKVDTVDLKKYKKKKKTVQHIIGRSLPLTIDTGSQENWYWFEGNLSIRVRRRYKHSLTNEKRNTITMFEKLLSNVGKSSISLYITQDCLRFDKVGCNTGLWHDTTGNVNNSVIFLQNALAIDPMTEVPYGGPVGVTLLKYTLTENSLELYVKIRTDNPRMLKFSSKTFYYTSSCKNNAIKKACYPSKINPPTFYPDSIDKPFLSNYIDSGLWGWEDEGFSYRKKSVLLKRRHSVRRKTLDPTTGKLINIRTAPRFTKVRFNSKNDVPIDKGYYRVYIAHKHQKKYIGDIIVSAHRWKIENGKRKIDRYKIQGV